MNPNQRAAPDAVSHLADFGQVVEALAARREPSRPTNGLPVRET